MRKNIPEPASQAAKKLPCWGKTGSTICWNNSCSLIGLKLKIMKPNKDQTKEKDQSKNRQRDNDWQKQQPSKTPQKPGNEDNSQRKQENSNDYSKKSGSKNTDKTKDMEDEDELLEVPNKGSQDDPGRTKRDEPSMTDKRGK